MTVIGSVVTLQVKGCNGVLEPYTMPTASSSSTPRPSPPPGTGTPTPIQSPETDLNTRISAASALFQRAVSLCEAMVVSRRPSAREGEPKGPVRNNPPALGRPSRSMRKQKNCENSRVR